MHNRWAASPAGFRPDPGPAQGHTIDPLWDDPRYDHLADTYSSHVNPVFWSLHGWVDDRIEDWKTANGVYGNAFWKGTWVGKMPRVEQRAAEEPSVEAAMPEQPLDKVRTEQLAHSEPMIGQDSSRVASHRALTRRTILGREDPGAVPPGVHALIESPHHPPSHPEEMEEIVRVIGECGIFHQGYMLPLSRIVW
jgi:hypothetical protein